MKLLLKPVIKLKQNINLDAIKAYQKAVLAKHASNASEENMKADFSALLRALGGFECEMDYASIDLAIFKSTPSKRQLKCIVETKRPFSTDFISEENANKKSLAQALYYYLQQQKKGESFISSLIITDFFTAFIFSEKPFLMLAKRQA